MYRNFSRLIYILFCFIFLSISITTSVAAKSAKETATQSQIQSSPSNTNRMIQSPSLMDSKSTMNDTSEFIDGGNTINNNYFGIYKEDKSKATKNVEAINWALSVAKAKGMRNVRLETGTYYVDGQHTNGSNIPTNSIEVPSDMTIDLNGSTLIQIDNNKERYIILAVINQSNVKIYNGLLIGDKDTHDYNTNPGTHEWGFGIAIKGSDNVEISNIKSSKMTGDGLYIGGTDNYISLGGRICKNIKIKDSMFFSCRRQGISITGAIGVDINGCAIYDIGGVSPETGIDLEGGLDWNVENITISKCNISNTKFSNIVTHLNTKNITIEENILDDGVYMRFGDIITIKNNTIIGNNNSSKVSKIYTDAIDPTNILIQGNKLENACIYITLNSNTVIQNNEIKNGNIMFAYSTGAIYNNIIKKENDSDIKYGIIIYTTAEPFGEPPFTIYLYSNDITGNFTKPISIVTYSNATVINNEEQTKKFIEKFIKNFYVSSGGSNNPSVGSKISSSSSVGNTLVWKQDSIGWWLERQDGTYPVSQWIQKDGLWYYFDASGYMVTGWQEINGQWYYLSNSGNMESNDWIYSNNHWYFLSGDGSMNIGWQEWKGSWYYLNTPNGEMAVNIITPDGYTIDKDGVWIP